MGCICLWLVQHTMKLRRDVGSIWQCIDFGRVSTMGSHVRFVKLRCRHES